MKVKCGDIIEIKTSKGIAYALYTHRHPRYGALLRVFDGLFATSPDNLGDIVTLAVRFATFFPLQAAVDRGLVTVVGNAPIPDNLKLFPVCRAGAVDPHTKKVASWWLWDGQREWQVGDLTAEERKLPIRGVVNDTLLIQRIEEGWLPEKDPR